MNSVTQDHQLVVEDITEDSLFVNIDRQEAGDGLARVDTDVMETTDGCLARTTAIIKDKSGKVLSISVALAYIPNVGLAEKDGCVAFVSIKG